MQYIECLYIVWKILKFHSDICKKTLIRQLHCLTFSDFSRNSIHIFCIFIRLFWEELWWKSYSVNAILWELGEIMYWLRRNLAHQIRSVNNLVLQNSGGHLHGNWVKKIHATTWKKFTQPLLQFSVRFITEVWSDQMS